jgi:starch-binding outer membrane protein, SusD/RagB family
MNPVTADYIIYPVPQSQLEAAPGLYTQNKGY